MRSRSFLLEAVASLEDGRVRHGATERLAIALLAAELPIARPDVLYQGYDRAARGRFGQSVALAECSNHGASSPESATLSRRFGAPWRLLIWVPVARAVPLRIGHSALVVEPRLASWLAVATVLVAL
jgi:hypothetical protein